MTDNRVLSTLTTSTFGGKNIVLNGAFDVWNKGTSVATLSYPQSTADRWTLYRNGTSNFTISRQTTSLPGIQYCARVQRNSGDTNIGYAEFCSTLEVAQSLPLTNQVVTYSFWARAGSGFSGSGNLLGATLYTNNGSESGYAAFTGMAYPINTSVTLTTSWQRFTFTTSISSSITQFAVATNYTPTGTAGANDYYEITGVQLERGSVATAFNRAGGTIQGEIQSTSGIDITNVANQNSISNVAGYTIAGKNVIINGAMEIWQRGTSFPSGVGLGSSVVYSADRWHWYRGLNDTGGTLSRQSAGLTGFRYCIRMQRNSGNTSTQALGLRYTAETTDSLRFAGKQVTLSFWARKGANYSPSGNGFRATIATGTGTDQVVHSFTGFTYIADQTVTLSDTWTRYSITGTCASNITQIGLEMFATPTGTAGTNDYMEITGIQLEEGSIPTTFSTYSGTANGELAACQRYYIRWKSEDSSANNPTMPIGQMVNTTTFRCVLQFPTAMRIKPSAIEYSGFRLLSGSSGYTVTNIVLSQSNALQQELQATITSGPAAATVAQLIPGSGSTTDYIGLTAEL